MTIPKKHPAKRPSTPDGIPERTLFLLIMTMVTLWAVIAVVRAYPSSFYPRFWDEAVYAMDVFDPANLFMDFREITAYAPTKLGYGIPLLGAVSLFGENGIMYFSTAIWALIVFLCGLVTWRRFGYRAGGILFALLSFSPFLGKYIAEAAPTLLEALLFTLLWIACLGGRFWITGIVVGLIAFVDFKWALPAGLAVTCIEALPSASRTVTLRLLRILGTGTVALAILGVAFILHPPYGEFLRHYITGHEGLVQFAPSFIFAYYLLLFGAAPATVAAGAAWLWPEARHAILKGTGRQPRAFLTALILCTVPILFHSVMGTHKSLRFFAVLFPLFGVVLGVSVAALLESIGALLKRAGGGARQSGPFVLPVLAALLIVIGSDGPARHLHMRAGIADALLTIANRHEGAGTITSYNWPVVQYGWGHPFSTPSFAMWGLLRSDLWMLLDNMMDRTIIESRLELQPNAGIDADSLWTIHEHFRARFPELFRVPANFYASDYYLAESTTLGIPTLRRWQAMRDSIPNEFVVYRVDFDRLKNP
ncbi:MAG: hypothetical protein AB1752_09915 [Candidatus Zixiibacteriota bacterium]